MNQTSIIKHNFFIEDNSIPNKIASKIEITEYIKDLDFNEFENVEELKLSYILKHNLDLSQLHKLKTLNICTNLSHINIILPSGIENLYIDDYKSVLNIQNYENLKSLSIQNYENLKNLYIEQYNTSLDLNKMPKLEKLFLINAWLNDDFSNLKNLFYLYLQNTETQHINLEKCENLIYVNISEDYLESIILPTSNKLKYLHITNNIYYSICKDDEFIEALDISNLYNKDKLIELSIYFNIKQNIDYNKFKDLEYLDIKKDPRNKKFYTLDINQLYKLKQLKLHDYKLNYIDFPYNYKFDSKKDSIDDNIYINEKVVSRRRICILNEFSSNGRGIQNGLKDLPETINENHICYRCKKYVNLQNKINIRKQKFLINNQEFKYNYISCC